MCRAPIYIKEQGQGTLFMCPYMLVCVMKKLAAPAERRGRSTKPEREA